MQADMICMQATISTPMKYIHQLYVSLLGFGSTYLNLRGTVRTGRHMICIHITHTHTYIYIAWGLAFIYMICICIYTLLKIASGCPETSNILGIHSVAWCVTTLTAEPHRRIYMLHETNQQHLQ
jgi:hypothetical protein